MYMTATEVRAIQKEHDRINKPKFVAMCKNMESILSKIIQKALLETVRQHIRNEIQECDRRIK